MNTRFTNKKVPADLAKAIQNYTGAITRTKASKRKSLQLGFSNTSTFSGGKVIKVSK